MRTSFRVCFVLLMVGVAVSLGGCVRPQHPAGEVIQLQGGWEYRWGDVPAGEQSRASWLLAPPASHGWRRYDPDSRPTNAEAHRVAWFRLRLPEVQTESPTLFLALQRLRISFEVLVDGEPVYRSGERRPASGPPSLWYVISLPEEAAGQWVAFRIESPEPEYLEAPTREIAYGPALAVHASVVRRGILSFSFGALFVVVGVYSLFAHWKRRSQSFYLSFSFGIMAISAGGMMLIGCELNQIYLYYGTVGWYLHMVSMLVFPVGLWAYVEQSIGAGWLRFVRRFWQFHIGYAAATLILEVTGVVRFYPTLLQVWFLLLAIESAAFVPLLVRSIRSGRSTARLFGVGMLMLTLCGTIDTLSGLEIVPVYLELFPWGLAVFIGILVYIQEDAFGAAQRRLEDYSRTLEAQTSELRVHRDRLEDLVAERTQELEQASVAAQAANRAKSDFLAHMSHELRTPLNAILGYAQILRREPTLPKRIAKGLAVIQDSGDHLLAMINEVLDLAKVEAGRLELEETEAHLDGFLHRAADMAEGWARSKGLQFERCLPDAGERVRLDERRLRQVLLNLLGNAVKFTPSGTVTFKVERRGDDLQFRVTDTGVGIPPGDLDDLFQPFRQPGDGSHRDGTGLGLAISQKLVRKMGGEIYVTSTPGAGSTFGFDLHLPASESTDAAQPALHPIPKKLRRPLRALVIDDQAENRQLLREILSSWGFVVEEAPDGFAGLAVLRKQLPELLLLDLMMPGLDGFATLSKARDLPSGDRIRAVAVSAGTFPETRKKAAAAGFDGFVAKPVRIEEVQALLETLLPGAWMPEGMQYTPTEYDMPHEPPPREFVAALYELARVGDVAGIEEHLHRMRSEGSHKNFTDRVAAMAEGFDIQELQMFLAQWQASTDPPG